MTDLELVPGESGVTRVRGELDVASVGVLRTWLDEQLDAGAEAITLDCRDLSFLDSAGIGVLVAARSRLGDAGELVLLSPPEHVRRVLDIAGVSGHLTVRSATS